jgi:hypothetical protein
VSIKKIRDCLEANDRDGACRVLHEMRALNAKVQAGSAYPAKSKHISKNVLDEAFEMLAPFSFDEATLLRKLWEGGGR